MSEKEIFDLMDELEQVDIEQWMIADELDEEILNRIKSKTLAKLNQEMETIVPFKRKRLTRKSKITAAIIILAVLVPASVSALNTIYYHYVPGAGDVMISDEEILCLDKPQKIIVPPVYDDFSKDKVMVEGGVATLTNVQVTEKNTIMTTVELVFPEENRDIMLGLTVSKQGTLIVNGEKFLSDDFRGSGSSINLTFRHEFKNLPVISLEDDLVYQFELYDGTIYEYAITLEKTQGEIAYEELGPTAAQHDLPITAVIEEDKEILRVNFITPEHPTKKIKTYGSEGCFDECLDSFVRIIDANSKEVLGKKVYHNFNRDNNYEFNVSDLTKPFTILLSNVTIQYYHDESFADTTYTIKVPNVNETYTDLEPIILKDYEIPVTSITLTDVGKENRGQIGVLEIALNLTRDYKDGKRIIGIEMWDRKPLWFLETYSSMSAQISDDNFKDNLGIPLRRKVKEIEADITGLTLQLEGNWEFIVE